MEVIMALFGNKKESLRAELPVRLDEIPTSLVFPNPDQPRRSFDDAGIAELAASIKHVGLIQPLVVRRVSDHYELIAGERRLRAIKMLDLPTVRCLISTSVDDEDSALMAIVENLQREDLHFFEEAECYASLLEKLRLTQDELAARIGKSQSFIANKLRLLKLSPRIKDAVVKAGLSERHTRAVLRLSTDRERAAAVERIASRSLSVKESEKLVDTMIEAARCEGSAAKPRPRIIRIFRDYKLFINTVNSACDQLRESGLAVQVEQTDRDNGVDILIRVSQ